MEYCLKDVICSCCEKGRIIIINHKIVVSHGICSYCLKPMVLPCENYNDFIREFCEEYKEEDNCMKSSVLECSSKGDRRFSALYAKVDVNGVFDTIENHYQKSKVFRLEDGTLIQYDNWKEAKGKKPIAFNISGYILPMRFGEMFYHLLWYKYLKTNKSLEKVLNEYDDYKDMFKSKNSYVCQADTIRLYMNDASNNKYKPSERGVALYNKCLELINILNGKNKVIIEDGDIFNGYTHIIGHQVNGQGVMGSGIAKTIKEQYPEAYSEYVKHPKIKDRAVMGDLQVVKSKDRYIANLFGQFNYGRNPEVIYTEKDKLKEALIKLKMYAKENNLTIGIPFNIGCGLGNEKWEENILPMIKEVFKDYYIIVYRL